MQRAMLESVKTQLGAVGIPAEVRMRPFAEYRVVHDQWSAGGVQLRLGGHRTDAGRVPRAAVPLELARQRHRFRSADIDAQISAARANRMTVATPSGVPWIERQVLYQSVLVPIAQLRTNQVVADRVQGWSTRLDGTFVVPDVWVNS